MNTINYDKYSTMSIKQLISALNNAEKKQAKIKEKLKQELSEVKELISYLKSQIKSSLNKPRFYDLHNSPSIQKIEKYEKENQELAKQARAELNQELGIHTNENDDNK
nr:hypothetical protein [uncultured Campylobacter sp.]